MRSRDWLTAGASVSAVVIGMSVLTPAPSPGQGTAVSSDAVAEAQAPRAVPAERPEQAKSAHDLSDRFAAQKASPSSSGFKGQPDEGAITGFDFYRDPLDAKRPMITFEEIMRADVAMKPKVMEEQTKLLGRRYNLTPKLDPEATMSRGKPLPVGPTARLAEGLTFENLAAMCGGLLYLEAITQDDLADSVDVTRTDLRVKLRPARWRPNKLPNSHKLARASIF